MCHNLYIQFVYYYQRISWYGETFVTLRTVIVYGVLGRVNIRGHWGSELRIWNQTRAPGCGVTTTLRLGHSGDPANFFKIRQAIKKTSDNFI